MGLKKQKLAYRIQHRFNNRENIINHIVSDIMQEGIMDVKTIEGEATTWEIAKACFASVGKDVTHIVMLQDDILLCRDFPEITRKFARMFPESIVTLFTPNRKADEVVTQNKHWLGLTTWFYAQAYIMPVAVVKPMLEWVEDFIKPERLKAPKNMQDDEVMATYCFYNGIKPKACVPSLVEHLGWNSTTLRQKYPNDVKFARDKRMARHFIGVDESPTSINWKDEADSMIIDTWGSNDMFCDYLKKK